METETATAETGEATSTAADTAQPGAEASSQDKGQQAPEQGSATAQPGKSGSAGASKEERLATLLARGEKDPNVVYTDEELDLFDEYRDGKLKPAQGKKPAKEKGQDEKPQPDPEEGDKPKDEDAEQPKDKPKPDPLAETLKELGAKSVEEIPAKVKELRKQLTGKDAQAVSRLTKDNETLMGRIRGEMGLWNDVRSGKPEAMAKALAHVEKHYGVKLVPATQAGKPAAGAATAPNAEGDIFIPREKFIDEESADLVNGAFQKQAEKYRKLEERLNQYDEKERRLTEAAAAKGAQTDTIDELVKLSGKKGFEAIAKIPNLRQLVTDWFTRAKDVPQLEVFDKVIATANEKQVSLDMAWAWLRAEDADLEIETARAEGRQEAYGQRPSQTLSGIQGKGQKEYHQYTDDQLKEMSEDYTKCPDDWFDKEDKPNRKTIPKRAHKYFFPDADRE